jgi:hypothetical protein
MKEYKIASANFVTPGESLVPDAYIAPEDTMLTQENPLEKFLRASIAARQADPTIQVIEVKLLREQKYE